MSEPAENAADRGARRREIGSVLIDLVVPVAGFYVLRAAGAGVVASLVLSSAPTTLFLVYQAIRRRRLDALAVFVLVIMAASVGASFVTGSPRFLLAKDGWFTAAIGIAFLTTLLRARPLAFTLSRALLTRTGMAARFQTGSWDHRWATIPWFRRVWRTATVLWGAGLLLDAAARVIMSYTLPVDTVPALGGALWAVTFLALQVIQHFYFTRKGLWNSLLSTANSAAR
ncbi:VC0807 family protein [Amycolatopsis taiwanensis]|uniref:Intracellular septation protein A n=1 Tax=Amycolatopsis taiwanensis TaxID=342230 RepID=A0A9W6QU82_9PSEU|nr:VC0807 family protein [Amycolatopsis taiwanensis]GLY63828.1 hypothetical protein Atai01_04470 [Amycolatopsis taiwanensis]